MHLTPLPRLPDRPDTLLQRCAGWWPARLPGLLALTDCDLPVAIRLLLGMAMLAPLWRPVPGAGRHVLSASGVLSATPAGFEPAVHRTRTLVLAAAGQQGPWGLRPEAEGPVTLPAAACAVPDVVRRLVGLARRRAALTRWHAPAVPALRAGSVAEVRLRTLQRILRNPAARRSGVDLSAYRPLSL